MDGDAFNFVFRACVDCNSRKAVAERHLSSVTLLNGPGRLSDERAADAAARKAVRDFHPAMPGVPMGQASETDRIKFAGQGCEIEFGFIAPPQAIQSYVVDLALRHAQGFFSLLTTQDYRTTISLLPPPQVQLLGAYPRSDWGHPWVAEVTRRVSSWPCRANVTSADGYFKAIFRRHELEGWFWAFEWNKHLRVLGSIAHGRAELFDGLPNEGWFNAGGRLLREAVLLDEAEDRLFGGSVDGSFI